MPKTILSWSSGKDSAWTLHQLVGDPGVDVVGLLTTVNEESDRVAMHAVRRQLLLAQAEMASLPIDVVPLPYPCSNRQYEAAMASFLQSAADRGVEQLAFGDLFLKDVRDYRIAQMSSTGIEPVFPIWLQDTHELASRMIDSGLKAKVTCIDPKRMPRDMVGRDFDARFLANLPEGVDPCGENGEFHSFVYDGPMFQSGIDVAVGEIVERDGFVFADLTPA